MHQYKTILCAIDGSQNAHLAFKKACSIALRNKSKLVIANVIDVRTLQVVSEENVIADLRNSLQKMLDDYIAEAKKMNIANIESTIEVGSPKSVLAEKLPEKHQIDLIVLGATGLNTFERLLMGSVAEYIIRTAPCDVLVVRTDLNNNYEK